MNALGDQPPVVAAIDVGTNSIHMVIARGAGTGFEVLAREKNVVRLGSGGGEMSRLEEPAIERGVSALRHMRLIADIHGAAVRAVATSAVREATNARDFLDRARVEAGIDVEVITGVEEARLIHLGAMQALPRRDDTVVLVDIGGGSTEVVVSRRGHILFAQSLQMGAVRFTNRFLPDERVEKHQERSLRHHAASTIAAIAHDIRRIGFETMVISSGTAESVTRMAAAMRNEVPVSLNGCRLGRDELEQVVDALLECGSREERAALPGVDGKRSEIIVAGAMILREVVRSLGAHEMVFSEYALREGVLLDTLQRLGSAPSSSLVDAGRDSVTQLARRCSVDLDRMAHINGIALALFRGSASFHGFDVPAEQLLEAAGTLWSTGLAVSHSRYQHHSYYIVRNADLMGFTDEQIEIIALACRYHRKGSPKSTHDGFARLDDAGRRLVVLLAGILRVAIALDRSYDQTMSIVAVERLATDTTEIRVASRSTEDDVTELNLYTANERAALLSESLGAEIRVVNDRSPAPLA